MNEQKICQCCAMPMEDAAMFGREADGSVNEDYCKYCYDNGKFTDAVANMTMQDMIDTCVPYMVEQGMAEAEARKIMTETLPELKRWKKAE